MNLRLTDLPLNGKAISPVQLMHKLPRSGSPHLIKRLIDSRNIALQFTVHIQRIVSDERNILWD
ncbi:hypothetical protein D3C86_1866750 [compost metagenome]